MTTGTDISETIWDMKYRLKKVDGSPVDKSIQDTWKRVSRAVARAEKKSQRKYWEKEYSDLLSSQTFLPAGRILAGAGTKRKVTLFNCFVLGRIEDDLSSIFEHVKEAALTMQQGGGIGHDFSTLRPRGAPVKGVGSDASGPVSFMNVWDSMCRTILSAGTRRGAMMGTLRCDHPDIEEFIEAKSDPAKLRMFNLSVLVTDSFMDAVERNANWSLEFGGQTYRRINARDLWAKIMKANYDYAEPGVIFIDQVNKLNPLSYCETISATNPCGEQPLPPYGACLLGSINLTRLVKNPFTKQARLDEANLRDVVSKAIRFLDNVIDISNYPLKNQRQEAIAKRRIGLGITGLADALIMCRTHYGSEEARSLARNWMRVISEEAWLSSSHLAGEKGAFPLFDSERFLNTDAGKKLPKQVRDSIKFDGVRNGLVTSIAPTGTISLFAGNVSSGIEPVFDYSYQRQVLQADGTNKSSTVEDYAYGLFRSRKGGSKSLPDYFVSAGDLSPLEHLKMQAVLQPFVDSAISKTLNCAESISMAEFEEIYLEAFRLGLKGCTTYRPNEITGSVLVANSDHSLKAGETDLVPAEMEASMNSTSGEDTISVPGDVVYMSVPLARDESLSGKTYKLKWPDSDHAMYVTINDITQDGRRRPFEIFINSKNLEHYSWTVALTRMISAVFRRGGDVSFVVEELKAIFDPRGGQWIKGRYVPSLLAAIGDIIQEHMIDIGFLSSDSGAELKIKESKSVKNHCPRCGLQSLVYQEGCLVCRNCGYSKCG